MRGTMLDPRQGKCRPKTKRSACAHNSASTTALPFSQRYLFDEPLGFFFATQSTLFPPQRSLTNPLAHPSIVVCPPVIPRFGKSLASSFLQNSRALFHSSSHPVSSGSGSSELTM